MFNHKVYRILEPLVWYHSEVSQLGPGRTSKHPLEPFLTDTVAIRRNCPKAFQDLLELWLVRYALSIAHNKAVCGNRNQVDYLLSNFPLIKKFRWEYAKLKLKMSMPKLIPIIRYIKSCSNGSF